MHQLGRAVIGALLALAVAFAPATLEAQDLNAPKSKQRKGKSISWAKNYLLEVKKHLRQSFVEAERVAEQDLIDACLSGLRKGLKAEAHKALDAEVAGDLREIFERKYDKISAIISALEAYLSANEVEGLNLEILADAGAKGMVESIRDPYSHVFTMDEVQKMMGMLSGEGREDSLGFNVAPKGKRFEVGYVMYGYPAYWAGIQMGDEVLALNGAEIGSLALPQISEILKVKPGGSIELTLKREGWVKPYTFRLSQEGRRPKDVIWRVLPGDIGYLRLTVFDIALEAAVKKAMEKMAQKKIKGLILDLRQNPGGALNAAVAVADQFIPGKSLITKTESNYKVELPIKLPGLVPEMDATFYAAKASPYEQVPMAVLIDHASASASELLSGALQDLDRAVLIGETTYGKGVGQTVIPLWRTGMPFPQRFLYLTVMRYTLPTGRSIHGTGVEPNVKVPSAKPSGEEFDRLWTLRESGAIERYIAENLTDAALRTELAAYDRFETKRYPKFAAFYRSLGTKLSEQQVREEIRRALRIAVERETDSSLVFDLQTDEQLQTAVLHLATELGLEQD